MATCEAGPGVEISEHFPHDALTRHAHAHAHAHTHTRSNLADTIYNITPARALDLSSADLHPKRHLDTHPPRPSKRKEPHSEHSPLSLFPLYRRIPKPATLTRSHPQPSTHDLSMSLHQSTCLNLDPTSSSNDPTSDLWILPDFEEWEADTKPTETELGMSTGAKRKKNGGWAPLVQRAVLSNRERLRRRLEGDGWDFVGGRYGEDMRGLAEEKEKDTESEESVDEEFDVVVLPVVVAV